MVAKADRVIQTLIFSIAIPTSVTLIRIAANGPIMKHTVMTRSIILSTRKNCRMVQHPPFECRPFSAILGGTAAPVNS